VRSGNRWEGFENGLVRGKKIIRRWGSCGEELGGKNEGNMESGFSRGVGFFLSGDFQHVTCSDVKRYRFTTFVAL
jgi:hypothetical protein